jgi:putative SOS response-associated peptidase YedK
MYVCVCVCVCVFVCVCACVFRCVVVIDGFYEWQTVAGQKQPYYVTIGEPMLLAGIFDHVVMQQPLASPLLTFSILTAASGSSFRSIHDRQPVMLSDSQALAWLDGDHSLESLLSELRAQIEEDRMAHNENIGYYPVTKQVSNAQYQGADCAIKISLGKRITSFFNVTQLDKREPKKAPAAEERAQGCTGQKRKGSQL